MYHAHPDLKTAYAAARHADFVAEAERARALAAASRPVPTKVRAAVRWAVPVRVLRGVGVAPSPAA